MLFQNQSPNTRVFWYNSTSPPSQGQLGTRLFAQSHKKKLEACKNCVEQGVDIAFVFICNVSHGRRLVADIDKEKCIFITYSQGSSYRAGNSFANGFKGTMSNICLIKMCKMREKLRSCPNWPEPQPPSPKQDQCLYCIFVYYLAFYVA